MKKIKILLLALILFLTSCASQSANQSHFSDEYPDFFAYEFSDYTSDFGVDNDGTLYLYTHTYTDEGWIDEYTLSAYDMDGQRTEICKPETAPSGFDVCDGIIYGAFFDTKSDYKLCSFDTKNGTVNDICTLENFIQIKRVDVYENNAYILGISSDRTGINGEYSDEFGIYNYGGEKLISVDITTGEITESKVEFPIAYSLYNGSCTVYGADKNGYYFSDFENKNKRYHEIEQLYNFDFYEPDRFVFTSGYGINIGTLCTGTTDVNDGISQVLEGYFVMDSFRSVGGYTFFIAYGEEQGGEQICRIKNSAYIKKNNKIKFIASEYSFDAPFGCGYTIDYETMPADSFALSVLSQDSGYDMCVVNSFENFASNIRDKGSFYPLNDIPNVTEYLGKCFPYIKTAATEENGDIWMLPVEIDIPVIVYNKDTCAEIGIDFSGKPTVEEYVKICETAYNSKYKDGFATHTYIFTQNLLIQYMTNHNSFDTAEFRSFAEFSKEKINASSFPAYFPPVGNAWNYLYEENAEKNCLFSYYRSGNETVWLADFDCFEFAATPSIVPADKTNATCAFITVNPASDNLEATLDYISSLAEYLSNQHNSFMLSDKSLYTVPDSLYNLYADAKIGFNVSEEICYESYIKYHSGEITIDEMTKECDRKMSAYMNE